MSFPDSGYADAGPDNLSKTGGSVDAPVQHPSPLSVQIGIAAQKYGLAPVISNGRVNGMMPTDFLSRYP